MRTARVDRLPMNDPADVSAIAELLKSNVIAPENIVAVLGKTEGNGCVNDFTRAYAVQSLKALLAKDLTTDQLNGISMVMSGGTEGGLSPHWLLFSYADAPEAAGASLAIASAATRTLSPSEIGRSQQSTLVREAVHTAMEKAMITSPDDVNYVQIKCPLLTSERINSVGGDVATYDTLKSMGLSRGASALGVAEALGEIDTVTDEMIGTDWSFWSSRASASAGIELMTCEVVVMGMSQHWTGPLAISHTVMEDAIDAVPVYDLMKTIAPSSGLQNNRNQFIAVLSKAEASPDGMIRGKRHTMLNDSDISQTRHARGFVGGVLAGLTGLTELFVSGGAEHQGPPGGGPVAIIYQKEKQT